MPAPADAEAIARAQEGLTVGDMIVRALQRHPERIAFISDGREVSYGETRKMIGRAVATLATLGLKPGDAVIQLARNSVEQFALMAACYLGGFRSVTLQPLLYDADRQMEMLAPCEAAILVYDRSFASRATVLRERLPRIRLWRCHQSGEDSASSFWDEPMSAPSPLINRASPETVVRIGFTSGTTEGRPKGVLLSSRALAALALANLADGDWPERPLVLCAEAIAGGFGNMIVPTLLRGGTFILIDNSDRDVWLDAVEHYRPNTAFLMPWSLDSLLRHPRAERTDWSCLTLIGYSGAVLSDAAMDKALSLFGPVLSQIYGQTEYPKALAILSKSDHAAGDRSRLRSLGIPYSGTRLTLLDQKGIAVGDDEVGELCVRGPALFSGYLADPDRTAHAFRGGWYHTGDLCRRDSNGYLHFVDRLADVFHKGGVTILPSVIEHRLSLLPGVLDAATVGAGGPNGAQLIIALVAGVDDGEAFRQTVVHAFVEGPSIMPDIIAFCEKLPRTLIGRLDRPALLQLWRSGLPHIAVANPEHFRL